MKKLTAFFTCLLVSSCICLSSMAGQAEPEYGKDIYGYQGTVSEGDFEDLTVSVSIGKQNLENAMIDSSTGTAVELSGKGTVISRNSVIKGNVLASDKSKVYFINSTVEGAGYSAIECRDGKETEDKSSELAFYSYGSNISAKFGTGIYADSFSHIYAYGSMIASPETAVVSSSYGEITIGDTDDAENSEIADVLTEDDRMAFADKALSSVLLAGNNALMITSAYDPEKEIQEEKPFPEQAAQINISNTVLKTELKDAAEDIPDDAYAAYDKHVKGSVILVKSTNADIYLEKCSLTADKTGTGYIIQTVISDGILNINSVPDGENYSGVNVSFKDMSVEGNISHEDYQRDLNLTFTDTSFAGSVNEHSLEDWNRLLYDAGYSEFWLDESYNTHHGAAVTLEGGSVWTVTEKSVLSRLTLCEGSGIKGTIYVNGVEQLPMYMVYEGYVVVLPEGEQLNETSAEVKENETSAGETSHVHNWVRADGGSPATCTADGNKDYYCTGCEETYSEVIKATGHNWARDNGGSPPSCTSNGVKPYICTYCGASYDEVLPATGHNWVRDNGGSPPSCTSNGVKPYICTNCGETYDEVLPATGHNMKLVYETDSSCTYQGQITYQCTQCTYTETSYKPFLNHDMVYDSTVYASCETAGYDSYVCQKCWVYYEQRNVVPALGHNMELVYETDSSCIYQGQITYQCTRSGCTYVETTYKPIDPSVHYYVDILIPHPLSNSAGHGYSCICGGYYEYGSTVPHNGNPCVDCGYAY